MTYNINIYKIWWDNKDDVYVGSTKQRLAVRMAGHRALCKRNSRFYLYEIMRENGSDFNYVLLESKDVHNVDEKKQIEQEHVDRLRPSMNIKRGWYERRIASRLVEAAA